MSALHSLARSRDLSVKKFMESIRYYKSKKGKLEHIRYLTVQLSKYVDFGEHLEACWENNDKLDAVVSGLTGYLDNMGMCMAAQEKGLDKNEAIVIPDWNKL